MPRFTQRRVETSRSSEQSIPQDVIDQFKPFIEQLDRGNEGVLEFDPGEDMKLGRKALQEAGVQLKKYVKVQKMRGSDNTLKFVQITKKEFDESKARAAARGAKLRGKRHSS